MLTTVVCLAWLALALGFAAPPRSVAQLGGRHRAARRAGAGGLGAVERPDSDYEYAPASPDNCARLREEGILYSWRSVSGRRPHLVHILGVSHTDEGSVRDVESAFAELRPNAVSVELCRSRSSLLTGDGGDDGDGRDSSSGGSGTAAGQTQSGPGALSAGEWLRQRMQRTVDAVAELSGSPSQAREMKVAYDLACESGALVILGDRPLEITWQRLLKSLGPLRGLRLLLSAVSGSAGLLRDDAAAAAQMVNGAKDADVTEMLDLFRRQSPEAYRVLVDERDQYLLWSARDSKASREVEVVLAVVGKAHLPGIRRRFGIPGKGQWTREELLAGSEKVRRRLRERSRAAARER